VLAGQLPQLGPVLTRPIRWELIAQQYDQLAKYATALQLGTAEADQILRRFTRPRPQVVGACSWKSGGLRDRRLFVAVDAGQEAGRRGHWR